MPRARRKRHEEHEEHSNHERWLVSYADMMTLLMVLFIVMFAISQVDQRRFEMLKDGMAAGFGATASPFQGSEAPMDAQGVSPLTPIAPDAATTRPQDVDVRTAPAKPPRAWPTEPAYDKARREVDRLEALRKRIEK